MVAKRSRHVLLLKGWSQSVDASPLETLIKLDTGGQPHAQDHQDCDRRAQAMKREARMPRPFRFFCE